MSDRIVEGREMAGPMWLGESGPAPALVNGSVVAGAALRAAVRPEQFGLGRTSRPSDRSRGKVVTANMQYGRYGVG